jgi:hypothetical protein
VRTCPGVCDECGGALDDGGEQCQVRSCRMRLCSICKGEEHALRRHGQKQLDETEKLMRRHAFRNRVKVRTRVR